MAEAPAAPGALSLWYLLALEVSLTASFCMITLSQDLLLRSGGAGAVALLAFLTPLSGLLTGALRAGALGRAPGPPLAPLRALLSLGLLLWGSSVMSTRAMRHLSAPVGLAMKSVKILPTMVIAALWLRKRFLLLDWGAALLSALGMALCLDGGNTAGSSAEALGSIISNSNSNSDTAAAAAAGCATLACRLGPWLGAAQMALALLFDGGSANAQEAIIRQFGSPPEELALYSYGAAALASLAHGWAQPGSESLAAGLQHAAGSAALSSAAALFAAGSCGATWCSLELIASFGASSFMLLSALAKALVTTLVIAAGKGSVPAWQLAGIGLVFAATALAALAKQRAQAGGGEGGRGAAGAAVAAAAAPAAEAAAAAAALAHAGAWLAGGAGLKIRLPGEAPAPAQRGGAQALHTLMTPRTAGVELGLSPASAGGGGSGPAAAAGLRRRGTQMQLQQAAAASAAAAAAAAAEAAQLAAAAARRALPLQPPRTPLRSTLSSALSLVSTAALGIQRPLPQAEALSPLALPGGSSSAAASPT